MNSRGARVRPDAPHADRRLRVVAALVATLLAIGAVVAAQPAGAVQSGSHNGQLVTATSPSSWTPNVLDGYVSSFAEVGDTMVVGGNFSQISAANDPTPISRSRTCSRSRRAPARSTPSFAPDGQRRGHLRAPHRRRPDGVDRRRLQHPERPDRPQPGQGQPGDRPARHPVRAAGLQRPINDIRLRNNKLYLTGRFTTSARAAPHPVGRGQPGHRRAGPGRAGRLHRAPRGTAS